MQDMKLSASATLIDQSMSPYHAGEPSLTSAHVIWSAAHENNKSHLALSYPHKSLSLTAVLDESLVVARSKITFQ